MLLAAVALLALVQGDTAKKISFTGDAGLVSTSGNTELTSVNLGDKVELRAGAWKVAQQFSVVYGKSEGEVTTSLWRGALRGDRALGGRVALFVLTDFDRNTFAGIRARWSPQLGVSVRLVDSEREQLRAEVGAGYTWQRAVPPAADREFAGGRAALAWQRRLGSRATLAQHVEALPNFKDGEDLRLNSETAVTAPITTGISLKASYVIRHDGRPEPDFKKTDRILTTGIQVTF